MFRSFSTCVLVPAIFVLHISSAYAESKTLKKFENVYQTFVEQFRASNDIEERVALIESASKQVTELFEAIHLELFAAFSAKLICKPVGEEVYGISFF